ncbi:S41 family peptidase [Flavivirga aquimarina]|uniref:S41 family peptidase n=1 Tax=Flavivirga aquimarina TaxID=2027862 RepID=A0ABT8W9L0_9FLAO|nr:S41 family peptidase [Flavivirga aquimarina]MDO5969827.1 S41 family peptidase [Flavivirga aquimarina]
MKYFKAPILLVTLAFLTTSCFEDNDDITTSTVDINDFVWKGMNSWYNWQSQVSDLADTKDDNNAEYQAYLGQFDTPNDLFNSLIYQPEVTDRFSWFIDDYIVQQQQFQGISLSHGIEYQSVQINNDGDVIIYVRHVADNSPASAANINRGDIINAINGVTVNTTNFEDITESLFDETVTLSFVSESGGTLTFIEEKTITAVVLVEDPVFLTKVFDNINGKKVGYLLYNAFRSSYNDELNDAFLFFKNENIEELILDLRINSGGSVGTSAYLASMIYAGAGTDRFADLKFNSKHSDSDGFYDFQNTLNVYDANGNKTGEQAINRLNTLSSRLYILISGNTASASEMVINGLRPFIDNVTLVGTTTYGKNVGSITLYDSPSSDYIEQSTANPNHLNAMQPIVFQIFNKNGESDYTQGFSPDIEVKEYEFWNAILPFGDENEAVLKAALDDIRGVTTKSSIAKKAASFSKEIDIKALDNKFERDMYIDSDYFVK